MPGLAKLLFVLLVIVPHAIEWAKERLSKSSNLKAWYIQPFNISVHILAGFAAHGLLQLSATRLTSTEPLPGKAPRSALSSRFSLSWPTPDH